MGKRRRVRRLLAGLILVLILLAAGWTGLWYVIAGRLADHVAAWEQDQRTMGWTITHGAPQRTGWPMAAGVTLPDFSATGAANILPGGLAWSAAAVTLALDIRHPNDLFLGVTGREQLKIAGAPPIPFQATRLVGRVALQAGDRPGLLQIHAMGVIAAVNGAQALSISDINAALRADATADAGHDALVVAATASEIDLPPGLPLTLGTSIRNLGFDIAVSGPAPGGGVLPDPAATLGAWRDAGGSMAVRSLTLLYGPLNAKAAGRFALGADLRPDGDLALHASGVNQSLDRLVSSRAMSRATAIAAKAMLGLLMGPTHTISSNNDRLDANLTLRDGLISLGVIPLLRLTD